MLSQFFLSNPLQLFLENGNWWQWTAFLVLSIFLQQVWFRFLTKKGLFQRIYELSPSSHQQKSQTPSLGGIMILLTMLLGGFVFSFFSDKVIWLMSLMLYFGVIGGLDDGMSVFLKRNKGLSVKQKFGLQLFGALGFLLVYSSFFEPLSLLNIAFYLFIIVGSSNATNLTDGLDGLLTGLSFVTTMGFFLYFHYYGLTDLMQFSMVFMLALFGFFLVNRHPAKLFMGDTGSLSIGAGFAGMAICLNLPWILVSFGAVYILETFSVILQVGYYKRTQKRFFKMAPLHHHFELLGLSEKKTVLLFWILGCVFTLIGLVQW